MHVQTRDGRCLAGLQKEAPPAKETPKKETPKKEEKPVTPSKPHVKKFPNGLEVMSTPPPNRSSAQSISPALSPLDSIPMHL